MAFISLKVSSVTQCKGVCPPLSHSALQMRTNPDQVAQNNKGESEEVVLLLILSLNKIQLELWE